MHISFNHKCISKMQRPEKKAKKQHQQWPLIHLGDWGKSSSITRYIESVVVRRGNVQLNLLYMPFWQLQAKRKRMSKLVFPSNPIFCIQSCIFFCIFAACLSQLSSREQRRRNIQQQCIFLPGRCVSSISSFSLSKKSLLGT